MTSIEWLASKLSVTFNTMYAKEIEQAKEMHRQEIIDAYMDRMDITDKEAVAKIIGEQYYQETFSMSEKPTNLNDSEKLNLLEIPDDEIEKEISKSNMQEHKIMLLEMLVNRTENK